MISERERASEILRALNGIDDRGPTRDTYEALLASETPTGRDMRRALAKIEAGIKRDRLATVGHYVAKIVLEKGLI